MGMDTRTCPWSPHAPRWSSRPIPGAGSHPGTGSDRPTATCLDPRSRNHACVPDPVSARPTRCPSCCESGTAGSGCPSHPATAASRARDTRSDSPPRSTCRRQSNPSHANPCSGRTARPRPDSAPKRSRPSHPTTPADSPPNPPRSPSPHRGNNQSCPERPPDHIGQPKSHWTYLRPSPRHGAAHTTYSLGK